MNTIRIALIVLSAAMSALSFQAWGQQAGALSQHDQNFMENAIQGSYAEIEASKLALQKGSSSEVKEFAQTMINDHGKMAKEASALASTKGYNPPEGPSAAQKGEAAALKALSGGAFDAMYVNRIGVAAHEKTVEMFEQASSEADDPDVKAMIDKTLPTLREHLKMAQALNTQQDAK